MARPMTVTPAAIARIRPASSRPSPIPQPPPPPSRAGGCRSRSAARRGRGWRAARGRRAAMRRPAARRRSARSSTSASARSASVSAPASWASRLSTRALESWSRSLDADGRRRDVGGRLVAGADLGDPREGGERVAQPRGRDQQLEVGARVAAGAVADRRAQDDAVGGVDRFEDPGRVVAHLGGVGAEDDRGAPFDVAAAVRARRRGPVVVGRPCCGASAASAVPAESDSPARRLRPRRCRWRRTSPGPCSVAVSGTRRRKPRPADRRSRCEPGSWHSAGGPAAVLGDRRRRPWRRRSAPRRRRRPAGAGVAGASRAGVAKRSHRSPMSRPAPAAREARGDPGVQLGGELRPRRGAQRAQRHGQVGVVSIGAHRAGLPQLGHRPVQPGAGVRLADAEHLGDLGVGEAGEELERDQLALGGAQLGERRGQGQAPLAALDALARRRAARRRSGRRPAPPGARAAAARRAPRCGRSRRARRGARRGWGRSASACGRRARRRSR